MWRASENSLSRKLGAAGANAVLNRLSFYFAGALLEAYCFCVSSFNFVGAAAATAATAWIANPRKKRYCAPPPIYSLLRPLTPLPSLRNLSTPCENCSWFEQHRRLAKLNLQAHQSAMARSDEYVLEALMTFEKLGVVVHELLAIEAWREVRTLHNLGFAQLP